MTGDPSENYDSEHVTRFDLMGYVKKEELEKRAFINRDELDESLRDKKVKGFSHYSGGALKGLVNIVGGCSGTCSSCRNISLWSNDLCIWPL